MSLASQVNLGFTRVGQEIKKVRSEMAAMSGQTTANHGTIRPEDFGANVGTGGDDTAALQAAWAALAPGKRLVTTKGKTYRHSVVLDDMARGQYVIEGAGRFLATDINNSAVKVHGQGVMLRDVVFEKATATTRVDPYEAQLLVCYAGDLEVDGILCRGGTGTGMFVTGVDGFEFTDVRIDNTMADGIHMTGGTSNGVVKNAYVTQAGDDGVSVVSYVGGSDPGMCRNIKVVRPLVHGSKAGRGVTCVGGQNIWFTDIDVDDTFAAGAYFANETYGNNPIHPFTLVRLIGGHIRRANRNTDPSGLNTTNIDHGSIMVSSQRATDTAGQPIVNSDLIVEGVTSYDTRANCPWDLGVLSSGGTNKDMIFRDLKFVNPPTTGNPINYFGAWGGGANVNLQFYGWEQRKPADGRVGGGV